jgi:hypothetical protein
MDLNRRDGWVIRTDLLGVEYVRGLAVEDTGAAIIPAGRVMYRRPGGQGLVPGTAIYNSEADALETLLKLLPLQVGLLEREVSRLLDQAARTRELIALMEARRDELEARRDELLRKGWG